MNMKTFTTLIFMMGIYTIAFSQKVYSVDAEYQADLKVFVVDSEYKADLLVFKENAEYFWKFPKS